jgi:hypothetical protein
MAMQIIMTISNWYHVDGAILAGNTLIETLPKILISRILIELISQE